MAKQLLIYEQLITLNKDRHKDWSIKQGADYEFARNLNSIPLVAAEIPHAAADFAVVFAGEGDQVVPVAITGLREKENLYVGDSGEFTARYIPAFLRRYPFVFASTGESDTFTLCIDEEYAGCNQDGKGERLFDAGGEQTRYLKNVLAFLKEYQVQYQRTRIVGQRLKELGLLEPMSAQFTMRNGEKVNLTGFMAVDRERLKALTGERFKSLAQTDELELIYIHLNSMKNFTAMLEKAGLARHADTAPPADKPAAKAKAAKKTAKKKTAAKK